MKKKNFVILLPALAFFPWNSANAETADSPELIAQGEKIFEDCHSCHALSAEASEIEMAGPNLYGVLGRRVGAVDGYEYSEDLFEASVEGKIWDNALFATFVSDPYAVFEGTYMGYNGIEDEADVLALMAYIRAASAGDVSVASDPAVDPAILAIEGDVDYGEYLASACLTCHQVDGSDQGLPSITGWPVEQFVTVMHAYKSKYRENPVMQQYAGSLADDEIAALAAYFHQIQ